MSWKEKEGIYEMAEISKIKLLQMFYLFYKVRLSIFYLIFIRQFCRFKKSSNIVLRGKLSPLWSLKSTHFYSREQHEQVSQPQFRYLDEYVRIVVVVVQFTDQLLPQSPDFRFRRRTQCGYGCNAQIGEMNTKLKRERRFSPSVLKQKRKMGKTAIQGIVNSRNAMRRLYGGIEAT